MTYTNWMRLHRHRFQSPNQMLRGLTFHYTPWAKRNEPNAGKRVRCRMVQNGVRCRHGQERGIRAAKCFTAIKHCETCARDGPGQEDKRKPGARRADRIGSSVKSDRTGALPPAGESVDGNERSGRKEKAKRRTRANDIRRLIHVIRGTDFPSIRAHRSNVAPKSRPTLRPLNDGE